VDAETLESIAPPILGTAEGWGILWRAWGRAGDPPAVNFVESVVVVRTTRGSRLSTSYLLDAEGHLQVATRATLDLRPGFRYILAVIPRAGIARIDGEPLPAVADPDLACPLPTGKPYRPAKPVEGQLRVVGSTTLGQLVHLWADGLARFHPKLKLTIEPDGSEEGLTELAESADTLAVISRPLLPNDTAALEKATGRTVVAFPICEDDIAVVVHPSNPVARLTPEQLKRIYADDGRPLTWGDLGVPGEWASRPVALHGRGTDSGTRRYLKHLALPEGGRERSATAHASDRQILEAVAADPAAIGYARAALVRDSVKTVPVGSAAPHLRRQCHVVVTVPSGQPIPEVIREVLTYIYRLDGQSVLFPNGFDPLEKHTISRQLDRLGVEDPK
jgi:phosphate transport system substrate-binding protein